MSTISNKYIRGKSVGRGSRTYLQGQRGSTERGQIDVVGERVVSVGACIRMNPMSKDLKYDSPVEST
jgi:hypothetical protein